MAAKKSFIYGLTDPRTGKVRYVGYSVDPNKRLTDHLRQARRTTSSHRTAWLRQLFKLELRPELVILEKTTTDRAQEREIYWIQDFRVHGERLTNQSNGGEGQNGYKHSAATKAKIGASLKGRPNHGWMRGLTKETDPRVAAIARKSAKRMIGNQYSKGKGGRFKKGRTKYTDPAIARAAEKMKGRVCSPEHRAKVAIAARKRICSDATRQKFRMRAMRSVRNEKGQFV